MSIASTHVRVARPAALSSLSTAHRPLPLLLLHHHHHHYKNRISTSFTPRRPFIPSQWVPTIPGGGTPQLLTATRTLPYSAQACYELIADVDAYRHFIPYCTESRVTSVSAVDDRVSRRPWPRTAELTVGYGPYREVFRSRVFCAPYRVLEAVAGTAQTSIPREDLRHYFPRGEDGAPGDVQDGGEEVEGEAEANKGLEALFTTLRTRWTFRERDTVGSDRAGAAAGFENGETMAAGQQQQRRRRSGAVSTEVSLSIGVGFSSAMYAALSQAAAPKVAGIMIEAFEQRAREVYGPAS